MRHWPRLDTLLARLVVAQMALVLFGVLLMAALSTLERNTALLPLVVQTWRPAVTAALLAAESGATASDTPLPPGLHWQLDKPAYPGAPVDHFEIVRQAKTLMAAEGLAVGRIYATLLAPSNPITTFEVLRQGAPPVWIQLRPFGSRWPAGFTAALGLLLVLAFGVTWMVVRHITQPLEDLRRRMREPNGRLADQAAPSQPPGGTVEIREMNAAYDALMAQLQRQANERALLLAGVSHDLRSPLARIRLAAEMLPETPDNADGVATVTRNVDVADKLIASFLEFVRTGTQQLNETVDAAATVRQAVAAMARPPGELLAQLPDRLLLHQASALLLERLVVNLVDNALKHGGAPVQVQLDSVDGTLHLAVIDSGPGLPAGGDHTLLQAFARGDSSRGTPGFGLGLAIVQQIVTRLQGQLAFERGTDGHAVRVILPLGRPGSGV